MKLKNIITAILMMGCANANAQSFAINTTGAAADNSAIFDISSTAKGVLVPRISSVQRMAIAAPAKGLLVYDSIVNQFAYYDGTAWMLLNAGGSSWTVSGSHQYSNVVGNVGIGAISPASKLVVANSVVSGGMLKLHNDNNLTNDKWWMGFTHGSGGGSADNNDRARIGVEIATGGPGRLFFTTGAANAQAERMRITELGHVGIGTASPSDKLHIVGSLRVEGGKIPVLNSSNSVYIGANSGTGDNLSAVLGNTAIGTNSMVANTSGFSNTAVGYEAMRFNNVSGQAENTVIGAWAFRINTTGVENTVLGSAAGISNIGGNRNTFIGRAAGRNNTGSNNVFLGYQAGLNETGSDKLYISNSNTVAPLIYGDFANHLLKVNGTLNVNDAYDLPTTAGIANQVLQTDGAGQASWVSATSLAITETDPQVAAATVNKIPKWNGTALVDGLITDNSINVGIGTLAPADKLHIKGNVRLDSTRLSFVNTGNSVFIGEKAGQVDNLTDNRNVYIGFEAGSAGTTNQTSVAIGYQALKTAVTASSNIAIGHRAMGDFTSGVGNLAAGNSALEKLTTGTLNTALGNDVLALNTMGIHNTAVGGRALNTNATGEKNTAFGTFAGFLCAGSGNVFLGFSAGYYETGSDKLYIDNTNTTTPLIYGDFSTNVLTVNGNMGIGTPNPTQAKLVVNGSNANTFNSYGYLSRTTVGNTSASTTADYSIYASDRIAAAEFNAYSDARIKNIKGVSNGQQDLQTLMGIEITDYSLKDFVAKGNKAYKKVIAQQVEKIYPQAVSKMTDVVPDIYQPAAMHNGKINLPNTLKAGDKVKLIFDSGEEMATVTVATATSFTVNKNKTGNVFVYGREVNDFRSVDYEAISMLNVSATQQLVKELQQQKERISQQQLQIDQLINELKMLRQPLPVSPGGAL